MQGATGCAGRHMTEMPMTLTYSSIISRKGGEYMTKIGAIAQRER